MSHIDMDKKERPIDCKAGVNKRSVSVIHKT